MKRAIVLGVALLVLSACSSDHTFTDLVRNSDFNVKLSAPSPIHAGELTDLTLHTFQEKKPVNVEDETGMLHIIIASKDLRDLAHIIYPERTGLGQYKIPYPFSRLGPYRLWVEIESTVKENSHGANADLIAFTDFSVEKGTQEGYNLMPEAVDGEVIVDGYRFKVTPYVFKAGEQSLLRFTVKRADGTFVELPPEAFLYGLTSNDFSFYSHGHTHTEKDGLSATLPLTFPKEGEYGLVAQAYFIDENSPKVIEGHFRLRAAK